MDETTYAAFAAGMNMGIQSASLRNPVQEWLADAFTGGGGDSGVSVTYNSALGYSSVFSAVSMISADVAGLPLNVQQVNSDGDKSTLSMHPAQWLLNDEPNAFMDSMTFRETLQSHALLWGNGYAAIERDGSERPTRLIPMLPDRTRPVIDDGMLVYENTDPAGETLVMAPGNVLHIKGLGWDGIRGHSVIALARNSWGMGIAAEKHGSTSFKNGARPSVVLETEGRLSEEEAKMLLGRWEERHGGADNQHRPAIMSHGLKVHPFSMSNEDAQWLESRRFQRVEVAAWFQLPPHKLGDDSRLSYNSIEAENRAYLNQTLAKWLKKWESECGRKLLAERVRKNRSVCIRHDTEDLLSADIETKVDVLVKLRAAEVVSRNEIRRRLNMPTTGPEGDDYTNPNTRSAGNQGNDEPEPESETASAIESAMAHTLGALISGEQKRAQNAAKTTKDFVIWCDGFYQTFAGKVEDAMKPLIYAYTTLPGVTCTTTAAVVAEQYARQSKDELLAAAGVSFDKEELTTNVTETVAEWPARAAEVAKQICEVSYVPSE